MAIQPRLLPFEVVARLRTARCIFLPIHTAGFSDEVAVPFVNPAGCAQSGL